MVASLVVFEDGLPRKSDYRHYAIREAAGEGRSDDVASIAEVTRRRFQRHVADGERPLVEDEKLEHGPHASARPEHGPHASARPEHGPHASARPEHGPPTASARPRRFAYPPNLFVVDGGAPQVNAAAAVLDKLGVTDVAVIGLAKRLKEVWVPSEPDPVIMPRNSEGLYLLQRVRDEAHRFAITYHRSRRSKRMTASALDDVRGLGEQRRKALVTHFGSVARLKERQRRGDHGGARDRSRHGQGGACGARWGGRIGARPPRSSAMITTGHRDDRAHARGTARQRRR